MPSEPVYLRGSPLKDACNVRVPMLFLHGQDDLRVPATQAIAMLRGIEREGHPSEPPQLVLYPKEGHTFEKASHMEDVLTRVLEFADRHFK